MARKEKFTVQQVIEACADSAGIKAIVAKRLNCDRSTVCRYAQRHKTIQEALIQADEVVTDLAESEAIELIKERDWRAIQYRLSTKGKARGYIEAQEIDMRIRTYGDLVKELAENERKRAKASQTGD